MSPTVKLFFIAIVIATIITLLLNMLNIPIGWEYSRTMFVAVIAIVIYAWLTRISDKLARAGQKTVKIFDAPIFSLLSSN